MALSLKLDSFTSLGNFRKNVLSDDYTHSVFETYKLKGQSQNGTKVEYKLKLKTSKIDDLVKAKLEDEGKLQFKLNNYILEIASRRNNDIKLHIDLGERQINGKKINFFGNMKTQTSLDNFRFRFGSNYFGENKENNSRIEYISDNQSFSFTQRNLFRTKNNVLAWVLNFNSKAQSYLNSFDSILGYESKKVDLYLQHNTKCLCLGKLTLTGTYNLNDKTAFSAELVKHQKDQNVTVGFKHTVNKNLTVRAKFDSLLRVYFAGKYNWNQVSACSSVQLGFGQNDKTFNMDKFPPLPLGFKFDVKI
ncbi:hypothetical protein IMG5_059920 [Ichthyophthirius multifiliis]|uniref:Uncharacterized protein n=1 Tax=Ichthyophthirius multifiliis TaxID=5932 RepID=G0QNL7_ICHMU|nr:hypothetical protein IMG5_059920 [Ichthyophthirius multifiliis]EGR33178.1 hypothetical protein IMG5_059920 [Ichthyophthirius multifiliis]|eukprot:XP_004037164.1 hypothetical protein IMG5_059920 [Ichthyophthirius multifiliis]